MKHLACVLLLIAGFLPASAGALTYEFSGQLTSVGTTNLPDPAMPLNAGDSFFGYISYDFLSPPPDRASGNPTLGAYSGYDFSLDYGITIGGVSITQRYATASNLLVSNGTSVDSFRLLDFFPTSSEGDLFYGLRLEDLSISFLANTGDAFSDDSLPAFLNPDIFTSGGLAFDAFGPSSDIISRGLFVRGDITHIAEAPIPNPEPATLVLLGSGLAGVAAWRRRKSLPRA